MLKKPASLILLLYLTLGCFRGYLALFDKGASEPKQIFPCQVSSPTPTGRLWKKVFPSGQRTN